METTTPAPAATPPPAAIASPAPPAPPPEKPKLDPEIAAAIAAAVREAFAAMPTAPGLIQPPPGGSVHVTRQNVFDHILEKKTPAERYAFMVDNWSELRANEASQRGQGLIPARIPYGANTIDSTLCTAILADGAITYLQSLLAPIRAFTTQFSLDRMKTRAKVEVKVISAGGTAQSNPTNFEDTTNFVGTQTYAEISPAQLVAGAHVTNAELNSGTQMRDWVEQKTAELGDKIMAAVNAIITTSNFTGTGYTGTAEAFTVADANTLWGTLAKANRKSLILSGPAYANLLPTSLTSLNVLGGLPGWNGGVYCNTYWTGATSGTFGFACHPQAIACAAGLPQRSDNAGRAGQTETVITIPGLDLSVALYQWFSHAARVDWATYDVVFGAAKGDYTAGLICKTP